MEGSAASSLATRKSRYIVFSLSCVIDPYSLMSLLSTEWALVQAGGFAEVTRQQLGISTPHRTLVSDTLNIFFLKSVETGSRARLTSGTPFEPSAPIPPILSQKNLSPTCDPEEL